MGIFFAIFSSAIFAINNYFDKFFLEKYKLSPVVMTIINGISGFIVGLAVLLFTGFYLTNLQSISVIVISGFVTILCVLAYYKALFSDETSRVAPLFQFSPIFALIMSFLLLGEQLLLKQYLGSFIIIIGSFVLSLEGFDLKIFKLRPAFWLMLMSSFFYAASVVLYKFAVNEIPFWHTLPYEGLGMIIGALAVFIYGNNRKIFFKETSPLKKKAYLLIGFNESIYITGRYTSYFALSLIPASIANILFGLHPFFVLICGIILSVWFPKILKEAISRKVLFQKIISIILIFAGLYLIFF